MRFHYSADITGVYDGDSVTAILDLGLNIAIHKAKLRLYGINTPEMRGGTLETKAKAVLARDFVRERILGKTVLVHTVKKGKYGRYLATIWEIDGEGDPLPESLNDALIRLGHAVPYLV